MVATFLALGDGLMLHRIVDPTGFPGANARKSLDGLLDELRAEPRA